MRVARRRGWRDFAVAMNAQWIGEWNLGPKAHPNDGIVDACGSETYGPLTAVDDGSSKYQANWNTPSDLVIGGVYRVTVWVGSYERNFIDIQPLAGGKAKNLTEGTEFNFQVGSTLPFKFSLETP